MRATVGPGGFADDVIKIVVGEWRKVPDMLFVYVNEFFGEDIGAEAFRNAPTSKAGAKAVRGRKQPRNLRTGPGSLRIVSGDLFRATEPNAKGNLTKFAVTPKGIEIDYGIDTNVVPYAYIHEYGGNAGRGGKVRLPARPYFNPGVQAFDREQMPKILARIDKKIRSLF